MILDAKQTPLILQEQELISGMMDEIDGGVLPANRRYRTALDLIVAEGTAFSPKLCDDHRSGPLKQCFKNAGTLAIFGDTRRGSGDLQRYVYCEGIAISKRAPICMAHAWVYDTEKEEALELTWKEVGIEYLGIPFDTNWFRAFTVLREVWGVLDAVAILQTDADPKLYRKDYNYR